MPIELSDYTPKKRAFLKAQSRQCVYVIGPDSESPCKIGVAFDLVARFVTIQSGNWVKLNVHHVLWCPGKPVAYRIEELAHALLLKANKGISGEWFDVPKEWAWKTIRHVARENFPTIVFREH